MAVISGGELVLADANSAWAYRTTYDVPAGLGLTRLFASYGAIYKAQLWVFVVVRKRALATRRLPFKVYRRTPKGREEARDSPYARLMRNPNPQHDSGFLMEWTSSTKDVYGEALWLKVRGRDRLPAELWPVHPTNIRVEKVDADQAQRFSVPKGSLLYVYGPGVASGADPQLVIPARDVVHFKTYNPDSTVRGLSSLEPLRQTLVNEDAARRANAAFWNNGARPSVALKHPRKLSADAMARLSAQWDSIHSGVDNFGRTAILEEGMEPAILPISNDDAQYIESRKLNREEVCAAYDVPPPVVHILDRATFSNITEQMRSMYRDTMAPHLGAFESTLAHQLAPDFGADDEYAEFLMDEVLRGDFEVRATAYQRAVNSGWMMPSEVRTKENLPFVEGSDRLLVNSTLIPIEQVDDKGGNGNANQSKALDRLWGRLGTYGSVEEIEPDALTAGLNGHGELVLDALGESVEAGETISEFRARLRAALA